MGNFVDVLVTGAGGFIGGHLVQDLIDQGLTVRAVDIKPFSEWHQIRSEADNQRLDLSVIESCRAAVKGARCVYNLAADMGGMGFIENNKALCMLTVLESTHMLIAARDEQVERFFYSSSACVYSADKQINADVTALKESDAYPAMPEDGYGWEKLFTERMCRHFLEDFGLATRVARYHNVYGPNGTYKGGREKAPAAICRKVAEAKLTGEEAISIWGDGEQTRSFMYIDDCVLGTQLIAQGRSADPVNVGSAELVSVNQMVSIVEEIAGIQLKRNYEMSAPQGVRGRNSDNTLMRELYGWEPSTPLRTGLEETYAWVYDNVQKDIGL
jgi:GDP-D-mannose 3',5'-epimerase